MPDLISREAVLVAIEDFEREAGWSWAYERLDGAIRALPADDRRCGNCKWWNPWLRGGMGDCYPCRDIKDEEFVCAAHQPKEDAK